MRIRSNKRAFSLVELVIVVVIIGVIAAIAVPRISRGARGANEAALRADLAALRNSIDVFAAEHGGTFPDVLTFDEQLTTFTDAAGAPNATKTSVFKFGPYLRALPGLPIAGIGATAGVLGSTKVSDTVATDVGWIYTVLSGTIVANTGTAENDDSPPVLYNTF